MLNSLTPQYLNITHTELTVRHKSEDKTLTIMYCKAISKLLQFPSNLKEPQKQLTTYNAIQTAVIALHFVTSNYVKMTNCVSIDKVGQHLAKQFLFRLYVLLLLTFVLQSVIWIDERNFFRPIIWTLFPKAFHQRNIAQTHYIEKFQLTTKQTLSRNKKTGKSLKHFRKIAQAHQDSVDKNSTKLMYNITKH